MALGMTTLVTLTACSPGVPVAYHVDSGQVDIAFCESFEATRVEINFDTARKVWTGSGPISTFGFGIPVSTSTSEWTFENVGPIPEHWQRVDYSFYDANGEFVAGEYLRSSDVKSSEWAWQEGFNLLPPDCEIDLGSH